MNASTQIRYNPWLYWFALLCAILTFLLLGAGGLVTSHEAGMSVPDWPNSYGYNMFLFPPSKWIGGIIYEHTHRLIASGVGFFTTVLAVWLWMRDSRKWMHWVGVAAFLLVVAQGVLGGLRVIWVDAQLGIFHAIIGQLYFVLMCSIALFTSKYWLGSRNGQAVASHELRRAVFITTILIAGQLAIAATMRQAHAGLSIPDFPAAYGKIWPDTNPAAIAQYNAQRGDNTGLMPITAPQVVLQMAHRIVALAIFILIAFCTWQTRRELGGKNTLTKLASVWLALIVIQIGLGAWTIWSNKAADVATAHVLVGALVLAAGAFWSIIDFRDSRKTSGIGSAKTVSGGFGATPAFAESK